MLLAVVYRCRYVFIAQDVMEHIFDLEMEYKEIARVLRPRGARLFTVPLINKFKKSERRASRGEDSEIIDHHPAEYHGNPVDSKGALVQCIWTTTLQTTQHKLSICQP